MTVAAVPEGPGTGSARSRVRQLLQAALGLGLAVSLLVWGLPYFGHTTWGDIWAVLTRVSWTTAVVLVGGLVLGLYCYTFTLTGSMRGLRHWQALIVNVAGSAIGNLLPAGGAAGLAATYTICRSWGFSRRAISTSAIVTGVWNVMARVALPVVAILGLLAGHDADVPNSLQDAALGGALTGGLLLAAFVAVIASERAAVAIGRGVDLVVGRLFRRRTMGVQELVVDLRHRINHVVRHGWWSMTLGLTGYFGAYYLVFLLCMHATDVGLPYGQLFAAFAIGRLLTAVGVTPGGLGVTESATIIALVGWGAGHAEAAAGAVLFSVFTHFMEIPLGALGWLAWSLSPRKEPVEQEAAVASPRDPLDPSDPAESGQSVEEEA
ncbi:MAG TPA: lysylphosphatidylglycerol synthase domain-containing protein [Pedococcus sp.]